MGHYHVQTDKEDPGPAFNWDYVIDNARELMHHGFSAEADTTSMGKNRRPF
jgi:N-acetylmuramoyl-L-alanine amidase